MKESIFKPSTVFTSGNWRTLSGEDAHQIHQEINEAMEEWRREAILEEAAAFKTISEIVLNA